MAVGVQKAWSTTAADNATADTNINYAEGQTPASLNNSARADMAAVKGWCNQISGAKTTGGSANAQTLTSDSVAAISTAYAAGMIFCVKAGYTNSTTTPTFNVDGVGAKTIKKGGAQAALAAGDITAGGIYWLAYEASGDCFLLLNPDSGPVSAQPLDATLTALAALSYSVDALVKFTAADAVSLTADTLYAHLAGTETFSGAKTFSTQLKINLNSGTPSPPSNTLLYLSAADSTGGQFVADAFNAVAGFQFRRAGGTMASPSQVTSGANLGQLSWNGYGSTAYQSAKATIDCFSLEAWTDSATGNYLRFRTTPTSSTTLTDRYRMGDTSSALELGYRDGGPGSTPDTSYTFALTDRGTPTDHSSGSAHDYTIPPASSVAWPANSILYGYNSGAGAVTIKRGSGVTFRNAAGTDADVVVAQYGMWVARRVASDVWAVRSY